jgi:hypothetical protein
LELPIVVKLTIRYPLNCIELKKAMEEEVVKFAKEQYDFNFDILFYDVKLFI